MRFRMISAAGSACVGLLLLAPQLFPAYAAQTEAVPAAESGTAAPAPKGDPEPEPTFPINEFLVEGNTLFSTDRFSDILDDMAGSERTAADVERARDALEKFYHDQGYPTVLVNIPEQSAEGGAIRLQVIESRISSTTVLGNRHFPTVQVLRALPSLAPGAVLYVPDVEREIGKLNRNPDLKVIPAMTAGKQLGTVEVELKVEDKSPFHGFLELNNRNSPNTSALRLNAGLHYDNLWSRGHSLSFQYQLSPEKPKEVEVFSGSYTLPAPWNADRTLVLYGVSSDSNTAFGEGFHTVGKGSIVGTRYVVPLASVGAYSHSAVLGVDYKNFREVTGSGAGGVTTPVEYLPFSLTYSGSRPDSGGLTLLNAGLNLSFRGAVAQQQGFQNKRYKSLGNYATATLGAERRQQLGAGMGLLLKMDGQITDQPLISNEQYSAGGMESVRGYRESALSGDNAFHATTELSGPDLAPLAGLGERFQMLPYLFYDCAALWVKDPLAGQDSAMNLQGAGVGLRGFLLRDLEYQLDWAYALSDTSSIKTGDTLLYFKVKYQF